MEEMQEMRSLAMQELRLHGEPLEEVPRLRETQPVTTDRVL